MSGNLAVHPQDSLGIKEGHTDLMLCAVTVMPTFRKVNDVVCRSALNAVDCSRPEFCTD